MTSDKKSIEGDSNAEWSIMVGNAPLHRTSHGTQGYGQEKRDELRHSKKENSSPPYVETLGSKIGAEKVY